ncbi:MULTISPECIES: LexA family protein [Pasteurellaceae]|uniref:Peptidase S24-like protein n=1 Tax=Pasteurella bettyae CCUG 2042 TaxID=1095749 RepID=I3DAM7_9PAST|nr:MULTISPECIES: S24 family peptidase [Pasteurellaceae]EIJ68770.1 peptidase S24-like protein [Pasteurella bettyae CCUG 2042]SUB20876.1 protein ImpA [Pasteurella bettyae]
MMNYVTFANDNAQPANSNVFSYHPMPLYEDLQQSSTFSKRLDLNLYCIKRPQQTCFIRVQNPDMLAWGIEEGDMLVVEKNDSLSIGDLVVIEVNHKLEIFEFIAHDNGKFVFFSLSSKVENIRTDNWTMLSIVGTVTNSIHQMKPKKNSIRFAA